MVSVILIILTVVLAALIGLILLGRSELARQPHFEGADPEDELAFEDRVDEVEPFLPQTLASFLIAAQSGYMPGGEKSSLPLFPKDEMMHLNTKYSEWAPEPYSKLPGVQTVLGPSGDMSPAPVARLMHLVAGLDNILGVALKAVPQPHRIERSAQLMQHKVWFGLVPVNEAHWKAKDLDNPDNTEEAMDLIKLILDIFEYLRTTEIQGKIRSIHNKIRTEIDIFQDALNALYKSRDESEPGFNFTSLWEEYMRCHFKYMEHQARSWVFQRLSVLYNCRKEHLMTTLQSGRQINETQMTVKIDHFDLMVLNRLLDLYVEADIGIHPRIDGLITRSAPMDRRFIDIIDRPDKEINKLYEKIESQRMSSLHKIIRTQTAQYAKHRRSTNPTPSFMKPVAETIDRELTLKGLQPEIENPPPLNAESWVSNLSRSLESAENDTNTFGFVVYRASYSETNEEWVQFLIKLEVELASGWNGLVGSEAIKQKATIHWVDAKEESIPEGDVDSIREHFKKFAGSPSFPASLSKSTCLAITPASVQSFMPPDPVFSSGDFGRYIVAVDARFKADAKDVETGHNGSFKILGHLVWSDLYGMHTATLCLHPKDFWSVSKEHPLEVYVGPTTAVTRRNWRRKSNANLQDTKLEIL